MPIDVDLPRMLKRPPVFRGPARVHLFMIFGFGHIVKRDPASASNQGGIHRIICFYALQGMVSVDEQEVQFFPGKNIDDLLPDRIIVRISLNDPYISESSL